MQNQVEPDRYYFLAEFEGATLAFNASRQEVFEACQQVKGQVDKGGVSEREMRVVCRDALLKGFLDNDNVHPVRSQLMVRALIWLCLTSDSYAPVLGHDGFIVVITKSATNQSNFRFMFTRKEAVEQYTAKVRKGRKYVVTHTKEAIAKAFNRKKTPPPKDPSLTPPAKPKPERWLPELEVWLKRFGKGSFPFVRECLEVGVQFVWASRQVDDASIEEIDASLAAMAEYGRLRLPFPRIWIETKDWLALPITDGPAQKLPARFGIAAAEIDGGIEFYGFADVADSILFSVVRGRIDLDALVKDHSSPALQRRFVDLLHPDLPPGAEIDDGVHRLITRACGDRLLELLFLLSTAGVAKQTIREGGAKGQKKQKGQRRLSDRDYTIVRVPLLFAEPAGQDGAGGGNWVRPHVRRAHMWGKNVRPVEEQRWVDAVLVGATRLRDGEEVRRPEYRVG